MVHLIFEGVELSGKSFLMGQVYPVLEKKYQTSSNVLNGCYWINSDVGIFGTENGPAAVEKYVEMAEILKSGNILFEKLHITDAIYQRFYRGVDVNYSFLEQRLKLMDFKIVLTTFREDEGMMEKRLTDRTKMYPHYERIAQKPSVYIQQQELYRAAVKSSSLPYLEVEISDFSSEEVSKVLKWVGEK